MKLYNTLSRTIEEIVPINAPEVTVYTCGPTVYDYPHVGNWFTFIRYDILIRTLKTAGYRPKWVMNITDVGHLVSDADEGEDKLEKGARRENKTAWNVAAYYTDYFINGLERLNFTTPNYLPRATQHIEDQIYLIKMLESKGYTYNIEDGVYYDTSKFPKYASFAKLDLDEQQAGIRVSINSQKRNVNDFALWKISPKNHQRDMEWDSPWGKGFPGWHIECSAMAKKYLGETIDIHAGGIDHLPVHHTNEIAQSEAATGKQFAKYWMHTNHIYVNNVKISKSLGNTTTLEDIEDHGFSLEAFRLLVLQSHYLTQSAFSFSNLKSAQNLLTSWLHIADSRWQTEKLSKGNFDISNFQKSIDFIYDSLNDDLKTPLAIRSLSETMAFVDIKGLSSNGFGEFNKYLTAIKEVLGINLLTNDIDKKQKDIVEAFDSYINSLQQQKAINTQSKLTESGLAMIINREGNFYWYRIDKNSGISQQQKLLIIERESARANGNWERSDEIRRILREQGVDVQDTHAGPIWRHL